MIFKFILKIYLIQKIAKHIEKWNLYHKFIVTYRTRKNSKKYISLYIVIMSVETIK